MRELSLIIGYRSEKANTNRVRITIGGNLINYPYELTTRKADLTTSKFMWNSDISTPVARYACTDAKHFYPDTPLNRYDYMQMPVELIPQEFIDAYDLTSKINNGYCHM